MATTLEAITAYLRRDGVHYLVDADREMIVCRGQGATGRWSVEVRLTEQGECLHLRVPHVESLGPWPGESPHAALLLVRILELHYRLKLGRFGVDPVDGEIDCEIIVPLEDAPLTYRQFRRCLGTLVLLADQQAPRFRSILATGHDPGEDEAQHLERFLEELADVVGLPRERLDDWLREGS